MTAIFISYRRSTDRQSAARVREQMTRFFDVEDLFLDSESIKAGEDWGDSLSLAIGSAKACLVMIGPNWLAASDEQGRQRLFLENDWVRREIEIALASPLTRLIPVLVQGADLPAEQDLPPSIRGLLDVQAKRLDEASWEADSRDLIRRVHDVTGLTKVRQRMASVLILLVVCVVYALIVAGKELSDETDKIDTHMSYLAALAAAAFAAIGRSFLADPLWRSLVWLRVLFGFMVCLGPGSFFVAVGIWGLGYKGILLEGMLIVACFIGAVSFLNDAKQMVKHRS